MEPKDTTSLEWVLNNERLVYEGNVDQSLLSVLRRRMNLCAAKEGCDGGECGSCTVLVNGNPVFSCEQTMKDVAGCEVMTWEGVSPERRRSYARGISMAGLGCGFCVSGMLMRWHAMNQQPNRPSRAELMHLLSQHICRCTGVGGWLQGLQHLASAGAKHQIPNVTLWSPKNETQIPRLRHNPGSAHLLERLLAGEPYYVDDLTLPGMLEASLVWSPTAHGQIDSIDIDDAIEQEGVLAILAEDRVATSKRAEIVTRRTDTLEVDLLLQGRLQEPTPVSSRAQASNEESSEPSQESLHADVLQLDEEEETNLPQSEPASSGSASYVGLASAASWESAEDQNALMDLSAPTPTLANLDTPLFVSELELNGLGRWSAGWSERMRVLVSGDDILWCGELAGLVVAETREQARTAASKVKVRVVESEDPILDVEYAQQRGWAKEAAVGLWEQGDVDQAFRDAEAIISGTWLTSAVDSIQPEPPSCLVVPLGEQRVRVYTAGVSNLEVQEAVAHVLECSPADVEVVLLPLGGSTGAPNSVWFEPHVARLAVALQRPVKLTLSRKDTSRLLPKFHAMRIHVSMSCNASGSITGLKMDVLGNTGGLSEGAKETLERVMSHACGAYRIPSFRVEARLMESQLPNAGQSGLDGIAQANYALEGAVDMMAQAMGMDGWLFRYHNVIEPGDALASGQVVGASCRAKMCLEAIREVYYKNEEHAGLALGWMGCGLEPDGQDAVQVLLRRDREGRCHLSLPQGDWGQELYSRVLEVMAQETSFLPGDFVLDVYTSPSAMREILQDEYGRWAVVQAARHAGQQLRQAEMDNVPMSQQRFVGVCTLREDSLTPPQSHTPTSPSPLPAWRESQVEPLTYRDFCAVAQVVIVHPENGLIKRVVTACDVGQPMFPEQLVHRIEGAVSRGLGYALLERVATEEGMPLVHHIRDMGSLSAEQLPYLQTILVTDSIGQSDSVGPEKGGENVAFLGIAPAIASASFRMEGRRWYSLPMERSLCGRALLEPLPTK